MFPILRPAFVVPFDFLFGTRRDHHIVACCLSFLVSRFLFPSLSLRRTAPTFPMHTRLFVSFLLAKRENEKIRILVLFSLACLYASFWAFELSSFITGGPSFGMGGFMLVM